MNRCSVCGYLLPGAWTECRRCGAPLAAVGASAVRAQMLSAPPPPTPLPRSRARTAACNPVEAGFGAPDDALLPGAAPRDIGSDTMLPRIEPVMSVVAPSRRSRINSRSVMIGAFAAVCVLGAAFSLVPHGHHAPTGPTILAPQAPFAGLPTSLSAVVRIEAESTRHTALSIVISGVGPSGSAVTLAHLAELQPGYQWVSGSQASTTNTIISVASVAGADQIAVSGTNHQICAFGRWSPAAGATYVTMDHVTSCTADSAPATGWSTIAGGSAQDLPDEYGN